MGDDVYTREIDGRWVEEKILARYRPVVRVQALRDILSGPEHDPLAYSECLDILQEIVYRCMAEVGLN